MNRLLRSIPFLRLRAVLRAAPAARIAHVVNPFSCPPDHPSYLHYAQPITFESMRRAREHAATAGLEVSLFAARDERDSGEPPPGFTALPSLERSTAREFPALTNRDLPFVKDVLQRLYDHSDAELLVLTNVDIGLYERFYCLCALIHRAGHDAFTITRRDDLPKYVSGRRLGPEDLERIYRERGVGHPGHDCFVFHRDLWPRLSLGRLFTGYPPWGSVMHAELRRNARTFDNFNRLCATFHIGSDRSWKSTQKHPLWLQNIEEASRLGYTFSE